MAATFPTEAEVFEAAIGYFQVAHRDPITGLAPPVGPNDFLGQQARALAGLIGEILTAAQGADYDAVPGTYTDELGVTRTRNSTKALDDWAYVLGVPSSTEGTYGRLAAQAARNGGATAYGTGGVVVATGAQLTDPSGTTTVKLRTGFTMPGGGSQAIIIDAVTTGAAGNLPAGTVLRWSSPPPGLTATVTLTTALSDGFDVETDVALALRIVRRLQSPPKGGTAADIREWAETAEDGSGLLLGIARAYVYPLRDGVGSVDVVALLGGSGQARDPGATKAAQLQTWLNKKRIATDTIRVVRPRFVSGEELTIAIQIHPATDYDFEWSDVAGATLVVSGTSGSTTLVTDQNPQRASLRTAVDNGNKPRIAINIAGTPTPFVSRVTAYSGANLTLETALPATLAGGETVWPAGGVTTPVASAILAYVNGCGPARGSYADELDPWEDNISIGRIAEVALSARDSASGDRVCVWSPDVGVGTGCTIKVGSGSAAGDDFFIYDNIPAQGPQLAECSAIIVKRAL